jgi:hypothetical protein
MSEILQERTLARVCFLEKKKQAGLDRNEATLSKDEDLERPLRILKRPGSDAARPVLPDATSELPFTSGGINRGFSIP